MKYLRISIGDDYLSNSQIPSANLMASWGYGALPIAGVYGGGGAPEHSRVIILTPSEFTHGSAHSTLGWWVGERAGADEWSGGLPIAGPRLTSIPVLARKAI